MLNLQKIQFYKRYGTFMEFDNQPILIWFVIGYRGNMLMQNNKEDKNLKGAGE